MTIKEYIASGKLEMYVLGHLSEQENMEIAKLSRENSELNLEINRIESAIIELTAAVSPTLSSEMMDAIVSAHTPKFSELAKKKRTNWAAITGWTVCLLLLLAGAYLGNEHFNLMEMQTESQQKEAVIKVETDSIKASAYRNQRIVELLRLPDTNKYHLESEDNSTDIIATLFYNYNELTAILDLSTLPDLGPSEIYQLWTITVTEEKLLYNSIYIHEDSKKSNDNLYIIDGVTSGTFVLSIETDVEAIEPSAIRFIHKEK